MRHLIFLFLWCNVLLGFSQSGNYFLSHYSPDKDRFDNVCFQIAQHENGMLYFATRSGLLQFDGKAWDLIQGQGAIYTLQISSDGKIFWGGVNGYGYIHFNDKGLPEIKTLSEGVRNIFQSVILSDKIYFASEDKLFILDTRGEKAETIKSTELTGTFSSVFVMSGLPYISTTKSGAFKIGEDELEKTKSLFPSESPIVFSASMDEMQLLGLANNQIYIAERGRPFRQLKLADQEYINQSFIVNGTWVNNQMIALGTLRGGLIFINTLTGKTHETINYSTGLPDNEVFTLFFDRSQCIWAAHEYGFTRVSPYMPFRSFNHYNGLQGNLLCAITYKEGVYVGTSVGLFKLEKEDVFEEIINYIDNPGRIRKKSIGKSREQETTPETATTDSKRRGLLSRIFKRNTESAPTVKNDSPAKIEEEIVESQGSTRIKQTQRVFRQSRFAYKKVKGIDSKITHLVEVKGKLIAGGLGGTFEISGLASKVISEVPTRFVYGSKKGWLLISTYTDNVNTFIYDGALWKKKQLLDNLNDQITDIFEGADDEFWLCALDKVYRIRASVSDISDIQVIEIQNPTYDEFIGLHQDNKTILANTRGFHVYNDSTRSFAIVDSLSENNLANYFASENSIWYKDVHGWHVWGQDTELKSLGLLNLFQNIRFLFQNTANDDLWLITGNNELFRFDSQRLNPYVSRFPLALKSVRNGELRYGGQRLDLSLDEDYGALTLEVVQPDFFGGEAIEYRYNLRGLEKDWTDWSKSNNVIEIPYLPSGDYTLEVQSRDVFGEVQSMKPLSMMVIPPFWKRPWFYALEVLLFSFLVILSFRLSVRYRIISRLLMLLTIIMLIQFIETVVGQTFATKASPVIDFFLQVLIAMLVLPIEGYLRDLMLRSLDSNNRFYRFISPKIGPADAGNKEDM